MRFINKSTDEEISIHHFVTSEIQKCNGYDAEPFEIPNTYMVTPYYNESNELTGAVIIHDYFPEEGHCEISVAEAPGHKLFNKKVLLDVYDRIFSIGKYNHKNPYPGGLNCRLVYAKISSKNCNLENSMKRLGFQFVRLPDKIAKNHDELIGYLYRSTWMQVRHRYTDEFLRLQKKIKHLEKESNNGITKRAEAA